MKHNTPKHGFTYSTCVLVLTVTLLLSACVKPEQLRFEMKESQRERDVLRVAYEAQQLRLKELENRLALLEDHIQTQNLSHLQPVRTLPTIRLNKKTQYRKKTSQAIPSTHDRHADRLSTSVRSKPYKTTTKRRVNSHKKSNSYPTNTPTLNSNNIHLYDRPQSKTPTVATSQARYSGKPVPPPANAAYAPDLSIKSVPPLPSRMTLHNQVQNKNNQVRPHKAYAQANRPHLASTPSQNQRTISSAHTPQSQTQSVSQQPAQLLLTQAISSYQQQQWPMAEKLHRQYIQKYPVGQYHARLSFQLAHIYRSQGKIKQSMLQLKNFMQNHPTHANVADALLILGVLQQQKGAIHQGLATLTRLTRLYPRSKAAQKAQKMLALSRQ